MPALSSSLIASLSTAPAGTCAPDRMDGLLAALAQLPDPRSRRGIRHAASVVIVATVCAVVAGSRSYTAIGAWVADLPGQTAHVLGIDAQRRPSEAAIRRLLQALDPDRLATVIAGWLATRIPTCCRVRAPSIRVYVRRTWLCIGTRMPTLESDPPSRVGRRPLVGVVIDLEPSLVDLA
jgi:hypothetical protein